MISTGTAGGTLSGRWSGGSRSMATGSRSSSVSPHHPATATPASQAQSAIPAFGNIVRAITVQGVGGEQDAAQAQLLDQRLRRRDLVPLSDLLVRQDEGRLAGERAEHLGGGL